MQSRGRPSIHFPDSITDMDSPLFGDPVLHLDTAIRFGGSVWELSSTDLSISCQGISTRPSL